MGHLHSLLSPTNLRRVGWLAVLGPLFFVSYNFANAYAASREPFVPSIVFAWERFIPFLPWTIVPYWSSDLLYALSFWTCKTREGIDRLGQRLLLVQVISVAIFIAFPLKVTFPRLAVEGSFTQLFDVIRSFDQPYNQAPSLHVSLAFILSRQFRGPWWGLWFVLIALSTLTTYQHHFIDLPTGLWAGVLVVAFLPDKFRFECRSFKLAAYYALTTVLFTAGAFQVHWLFAWPAFSFSLLVAAYTSGRVEVLGKRGGFVPPWMWPYTVFALINSRLWSSEQTEIAGGVWLARAPRGKERDRFNSIVDLTGELPLKADAHVPMLDLVPPSVEQIEAAVEAIEGLKDRRPTLVCCALGYSRSAAAVAAWRYNISADPSMKSAIETVYASRPNVVIGLSTFSQLESYTCRSDRKRS
ncbi:MAG: phosphatase PAP2/dual specificity phosphatase family protein [Acidobacteria bacterium]|nr:phosphatase PAP2/dual specificity phosphatase family protein [Acidobacteriota bacterium]